MEMHSLTATVENPDYEGALKTAIIRLIAKYLAKEITLS